MEARREIQKLVDEIKLICMTEDDWKDTHLIERVCAIQELLKCEQKTQSL
jgi:hypothetical protein